MRFIHLATVFLILLIAAQPARSAEVAKEKITLAYAAVSPSM
jgi:hypothetical protein